MKTKKINEVEKLQAVFLSCKTKEQLKGAWKYAKLFKQKHPNWEILVHHNPGVAWVDGWILGFCKTFLSQVYANSSSK